MREPLRLPEDEPAPSVSDGAERTAAGRFTRGNRAAVGRSSRRAKLDESLRRAVREEDVERIARRLVADAARGSVRAAELLFDRVLGKARVESPAGAIVSIGDVRTLQGCRDAASAIVHAAAAGELDLDAARALSSMVDATRAALVAVELEQRIASLETAGGKP